MAANNFSLPRMLLCDLLAASPTFRTLVGAADSTTASRRIKSPYAGDVEAGSQRRTLVDMPRAIINRGDEWERDKIGTCFGRSSGNLVLSIQALPDPAAEGDPDAELDLFETAIGDIMAEVEARESTAMLTGENVRSEVDITQHSHLVVTKWACLAIGEGEQKNENGLLWYGAILIVWFVG